jgi:hypothetical protein
MSSAATASQPDAPTAKPKRKWLRRTFIASQVLLGLGLGLVITEQVFAKRDDKAFPHVNFYVADPELGVRLEPGATMRFRFRDNPTSSIQINPQGYRGEAWPAPGESSEEIIVLGDSQVFGLGVEDAETFSAKLAEHTGRPVRNAGVPTYGPPEYLALAAELLAERKPKTLVVTINFLNDAFEIDRPNKDRHTVWDGWAVRTEHAPADVSSFPGRKWLYSQSHAFYAFRRWQHERGKAEVLPGEAGESVDFGTPSEGTFKDLVVDSQAAHAQRDAVLSAAEQRLVESRQRMGVVGEELAGKRDRLDRLVIEASGYEFDNFDAEVARSSPGDIVEEDLGEEGRSVVLTAALIRKAARERAEHLERLQRQQERKGNHEVKDLRAAEQQLLTERAALRQQIAAGTPLVPPPKSVFDAYLRELQSLCAQHGTELVLLALPVDVQVDPSEWDKYGVEDRPDMSESLVLLDDLVANAEQLGIRALHVTEALRAAEPGAFLDADIHMTARGHAAVAEALAARLTAPLPLELPGHGLPEGRSFVPAVDEWDPIGEVMVAGSSNAGCSTQIEREWLRVLCRRPFKNKREGYGGIEVLTGATSTTMTLQGADGQSLVTPLTIGEPFTARFVFGKKVRELRITWPLGEDGKPKFVGEFVDVEGQAGAKPPSAAVEQLCSAYGEVEYEQWCAAGDEESAWDCRAACTRLWGDPSMLESCTATFGAEHLRVLSCVQHDPLSAPTCPSDSVHAFASNACFAVCDAAHPCASGVCTPWQGGGVCTGAATG